MGEYDGIALGHGVPENPVLSHEYWGTGLVIEDLSGFEGWYDGLVVLPENPAIRDQATGLVVVMKQK